MISYTIFDRAEGRKETNLNYMYIFIHFLYYHQQIDNADNIWAMSNKMPIFIYSKLNVQDFNFRIFKQTIKDAVKNTNCAKDYSSHVNNDDRITFSEQKNAMLK